MGTLSVDKLMKTSTGAAEFTLPATDGTSGQAMITDGSGQLSLGDITFANMQDISTANRLVGAVTVGTITEVQAQTDMIADNAVTLPKMEGITRGSVIIGNATSDPSYLAIGASGEVLTSDGSDMAWATVAPASDNTPSFFAFLATNFTSTYATFQKLPIANEHWDTDSAWDTTNYKFVDPAGEAGKYSFTSHIVTSDHAAGDDMTHNLLYLNGVQQVPTGGTNEGAAQYVRYTTTSYLTLAVSDYVELYVYTTSNNTLTFYGGTGVGSAQCWFEGHKLAGV